jgi:hypothetical protein
MDGFLEDEGPESIDGPVSKLLSQTPIGVQLESNTTSRRVVDRTSLYGALLQADVTTIDVPTVTVQLKQLLLETVDASELPLGTL